MILNSRLASALTVIVINLIVAGVLLTGVELLARSLVPEPKLYSSVEPGQYFRFQPYLQSSNEGPLDSDGVWFDRLHNQQIPYHIKANSLGFRIDRELDTTTVYNKKPNERVVLLFGGSAVYGFGNTSNSTTSAGWLQRKLNEQQSERRYTVFNMGNAGWVAYQQLIALNLYGLNLSPDWVVFMDARNDVYTIPALTGEDVGFHPSTSTMRNLVDGYLYRQPKPDFFRSEFENELIHWSAAYRYLSGKKYIPRFQLTRFPEVRGWADIDRTIDFYLRTQRSVLLQCPSCQYILSTQPLYRHGRTALRADARTKLKGDLNDLVITSNSGVDAHFEDVLMYAYGRIIDEMPVLCRAHGSKCRYKAMDEVFPSNDVDKNKYFVDDVHLRDEGNELLAAYFAKTILEVDAR
jgi:hypothetical protein